MKTKNIRKDHLRRSVLAIFLVGFVGLATFGCGEAISVDGIDTGGGGGDGSSLMLSWNAPTTNEDGSALEDLAGYRLHYGTAPGQYSQVINVGYFTTAEIGDLAPGTYYISVTAYDIYGNESDYSNEIHHTFL